MFSDSPEDRKSANPPDAAEMLRIVLSRLDDITEVVRRQQNQIEEMDTRLSIGEHEKMLDYEEAVNTAQGRVKRTQSPGSRTPPDLNNPAPDRRKSVFLREAEASDAAAATKQVVIHLEPPSHKHIYLDSTELSDFTKFIIQWFEYEQINGLKLEPAQIVSRRIRNLLTYNNNITDEAFVKLTAEKFCGLMAKETKVYSKVQFVETLSHALRHMRVLDWSSVRPNSHEHFFQEILKRKSVFMRTFRIMMEENSRLCPPVSGKEYGSAYVFLNLIEEKYNKRVLAEIPKISETNYRNIEEFLDTYVEKANEHYEASKAVRLIPYESADFQRRATVPRRPFTKETGVARTPDRGNGYQSDRKLNTVEDVLEVVDYVEESDDEYEMSDVRRVDFLEDPEDEFQDQVREMVHQDPDLNEQQMSQLLAVDKPVATRGCVAYALYGNCLRGDQCKHSQGHNETVAKDTRRWMIKKLSQMIQDEDNPRKVLSRPKP
jgi:hypothetical protein